VSPPVRRARFFGNALPYLSEFEHTGALVVIEGPDGVGRSTQIAHLASCIEGEGRAIAVTGLTRSELAGRGISRAKAGNTLGPITYELFYATDFADLFENQIIPALKAGFVVLADRYIYTNIARSVVRGQDPDYIREVYSFAIVPDLVLFLRLSPERLVERVLQGKGLNHWESGMDLRLGNNLYDSFLAYQTLLLGEFDRMAETEGFVTVDASRSIEEIQQELRERIGRQLDVRLPKTPDRLPFVVQAR
jgi:dTMP kinase